jgi:hypothetical protein
MGSETKCLLGFNAKILLHRRAIDNEPAEENAVQRVYEVRRK